MSRFLRFARLLVPLAMVAVVLFIASAILRAQAGESRVRAPRVPLATYGEALSGTSQAYYERHPDKMLVSETQELSLTATPIAGTPYAYEEWGGDNFVPTGTPTPSATPPPCPPGGIPDYPGNCAMTWLTTSLYLPLMSNAAEPRHVKLLVIAYKTVVTGMAELPDLVDEVRNRMSDYSKSHDDPTPSVVWDLYGGKIFTVNMGAPVMWVTVTINGSQYYTKFLNHAAVFQRFNICYLRSAGYIDEVWMYDTGMDMNAYNPSEWVITGPNYNQYWYPQNPPNCGKPMNFFNFLYANSYWKYSDTENPMWQPVTDYKWQPAIPEQATHAYGHLIEWEIWNRFFHRPDHNACDYMDTQGHIPSSGPDTYPYGACETTYSKPRSDTSFFGLPSAANGWSSGCGSVHYPPNSPNTPDGGYIFWNETYTDTRCLDMTWEVTLTQSINCLYWGCSEAGFERMWYQHFPARGNWTFLDRYGELMPNIWDMVFNP